MEVMAIKKIPKSDGSFRYIYIPTREVDEKLIEIQKDIGKIIFPPYITGFSRFRNVCHYVKPHLKRIVANKAISVDIYKCFDNIKREAIEKGIRFVLEHYTDIDPAAKNRLKKLLDGEIEYVLYKGFLPQGFRTSPTLSNIALAPVDETIIIQLSKILSDTVYTRYADNIMFSSFQMPYEVNSRKLLVDIVDKELNKIGLRINRDKIRLYNTDFGSTHTKICGISIDLWRGKLKPTRKMRHLLRGLEYFASKTPGFNKNKLNGVKGWINMIEKGGTDE